MKIGTLVLIFSLFGFYAYANEQSSIGYKTVELALEALKNKQGTKLSVQGGWTIVEDKEESNMVLWSFTPSAHPAYPAAVKRKVLERDGKVYIQMSALCQAKKAACDKLMQEFEQLNKNIMKN
ncbi:molecular chaperone DnaJ [Pseudoalteromonas sp. T1lg48]|uniref:molecular chaperone DnaJ n=1 Tax=Pseudoalteromonas sp. T1lg48 TaxID=2077100 RepID=UPI000CF5E679|nr:molecular chaperone DnaJ [Pseudoalteromonas sp. T1lg48]